MQKSESTPADNKFESVQFETILKKMLYATKGRLGDDFLDGLVQAMCEHLGVDFAFIGRRENELLGQEQDTTHLQFLAVSAKGESHTGSLYELEGSPCQPLLEQGLLCVPEKAQERYPNDKLIQDFNAEGFLGVTLIDSNNATVGVLAILTHEPLHSTSLLTNILQIFSYRVSSELERQLITKNLQDEVLVNQAQLDSVPALMFMLSQKGEFLRWNQYFRSKFGYSHEEMFTKNVIDAVHETDRKRVELEMKNVLDVGKGSIYLNGITKSGEVVPLLATTQTAIYENEPVIVGVALDMTEQQNVEHSLLRSQGRLARKNSQLSVINTLVERLHASHSVKHIAEEVVSLLQSIHEDTLLIFTTVSSSGENMQISASSGVSQPVIEARSIFPFGQMGSPTGIAMLSRKLEVFPMIEEDKRIDPLIKEMVKFEKVKGGIVIPLIYQNEALGAVTIGFKYDSKFPSDELEFYRTIGSSISLALANARQYELMESLATHDNLTGLPNRNALNQDSRVALKALSRNEKLLGLILVDLDRFKEINDTLDHQIGDKLLKLVGPRISDAINDTDTRVYRLGGDEFCVLVCNKSDLDSISAIAELIKISIARAFVVDGLNLEISSSIGVMITRGEQYSFSEMLRCAELAMYHAKNEGRSICEYTPSLDADTNQRFVIMSEMAEAIRNDELVLHYQPKYELKTGKIIGCEALVRWQHKQYGLLPPAKFIPLVELTQLIRPLTYWVMKTAMAQMQQWKREGILINVAINLSTRNLTDEDFIGQVDSLMQEFEIEASEIEFEVTETALMSNLDQAMQQLNEFNLRGIHCSLDDYGTGYSSLSYIKKLPLDVLKIDRSFISQMLEDKEDRIIAQSTIDLAHSLGMKVIAEGVEDENTLRELAAQGCDYIQGYHISEPVDAESLAKLYWEHR
ncbi:bifunctional diguanylate cyclase/phosphodiesterase [Aliikangiella coralliicola]|uniref:EAL domain-containing protein n=1 Tax=Aliikangiella coralliicola TaxID=2592383 RepID=A0A545UF92_9GAMM|nr:EAL domain-containing protein [Aliikangiella coralliicola]TQV88134.1 EAL domain-containing protein [Aliikangiella coralliicola]